MSDEPDSLQLVELTNELHAMWARLNVIATRFPEGDRRRAVDAVQRTFPALFMELRDAIGCAVLRENRSAADSLATREQR